MRLANDICRCMDSACPLADQCARYQQRDHTGERTPVCDTMRCEWEECTYFIQQEGQGELSR